MAVCKGRADKLQRKNYGSSQWSDTSKLSEKIYKDLKFEEADGRIRRPVSDVGTLADYVNSKINRITVFRNRCKVEATVPHSMDDDDILSYSEETMEFIYDESIGWRLNTLVF